MRGMNVFRNSVPAVRFSGMLTVLAVFARRKTVDSRKFPGKRVGVGITDFFGDLRDRQAGLA